MDNPAVSEFDGKRLEKALEEFASSPLTGRLSICLYPGYWVSRPLPKGDLSVEELEEWAKIIARDKGANVILTTPNGVIIRIAATGKVTGRIHESNFADNQ